MSAKPAGRRGSYEHGKSRPASAAGAWLPWHDVECVCRLNLSPPSRWRVLLAVLLTTRRYGGRPAHLGIADLAKMTGLSQRTIKRSVTQLLRQGLLVRQGRYERLQVALDTAEKAIEDVDQSAKRGRQTRAARGATTMAPPRGQQGGPSPTCLYVSSSLLSILRGAPLFSPKQKQLIADVLSEASGLLGADVGDLPLSAVHSDNLGLPDGTTYADALTKVASATERRNARDFVKAILALRNDPRVQGDELEL